MWSRRSRSSSPSLTAVARTSSFGTWAGRPCRRTRSPSGAPSTRRAGGTSSPASATSRKVVRSTRHGEDEHFFLIAMPVDVETEIEIDRPREECRLRRRPGKCDRLVREHRERRVEEGAVGARIAFVARFLGRRLAYTYEIRDLVSGERLVMSTTDGPFPMETT